MMKFLFTTAKVLIFQVLFFFLSTNNLAAQCAAPTSSIVQNNNCLNPNGAIIFNAPAPLANYLFSIDGGSNFYPAGDPHFNSLSAGSYATVSKNIATGCISTVRTKVITNPTVASAVSNITVVTNCTTPNGALTFTGPAPLSQHVFSVDGGLTFHPAGDPTFSGLSAGSYATIAKNVSSGCMSGSTTKNIAGPNVAEPTGSVTNNTNCAAPNGKIVFNGPAPLANYDFSIDGGVNFHPFNDASFSNLTGGTYQTIVRRISSGCLSNAVARTITNPVNAGVNQTICLNQTATMTGSVSAAATWTATPGNPAAVLIANPAGPTTTIKGFTATGVYTFTLSNAACSGIVTVTVTNCSSPLACGSGAILFQTDNPGTTNTNMMSVDLATGVQTLLHSSIMSAPYSINAIGYNLLDNEIWGSLQNVPLLPTGTMGSIVQVGADGIPHEFPIAGLYTSGYNVGEAANGFLYLHQQDDNKIFKVDINPASPAYLTLVATITLSTSMHIADYAYNPIDGMLYAVDNDVPHKLYKINSATGAVTTIGVAAAGSIFANANFGAAYIDVQGNFYIGDNQSGNLYIISDVSNISGNITPVLFSSGQSGSGNDGALCPDACVRPNAGADKGGCMTDVITMSANAATGTSWIAEAGNPGTASITNATAANTSINGFSAPGVYEFIWTNGLCSDTATINITDCVTPVTLVYFTGTLVSGQTKLLWQTSSEINSSKFVIEKSTDGGNVWASIGQVAARGNSGYTQYYSFTDNKVSAPKNLYRLRIIDLDNNYKNSNIVFIANTDKYIPVLLFPSPSATGSFNIIVAQGGKAAYQIADAAGKIIATENFTGRTFVSGLAPNTYFVKIITTEGVVTKKVLVLNK